METTTVNEPMNTYKACSIVEGFGDRDDYTQLEQLEAWAYLIKEGSVWTLQGWYGRNAMALINAGYISKDGEVLTTDLD
jgi:hypothetical protein